MGVIARQTPHAHTFTCATNKKVEEKNGIRDKG
jgi:hypothetical protein